MKKTLTHLLEQLAEDNRLSFAEAKRILSNILLKINQWKNVK